MNTSKIYGPDPESIPEGQECLENQEYLENRDDLKQEECYGIPLARLE
jgi:hypothetical protein